jgi:hypothetical protein
VAQRAAAGDGESQLRILPGTNGLGDRPARQVIGDDSVSVKWTFREREPLATCRSD